MITLGNETIKFELGKKKSKAIKFENNDFEGVLNICEKEKKTTLSLSDENGEYGKLELIGIKKILIFKEKDEEDGEKILLKVDFNNGSFIEYQIHDAYKENEVNFYLQFKISGMEVYIKKEKNEVYPESLFTLFETNNNSKEYHFDYQKINCNDFIYKDGDVKKEDCLFYIKYNDDYEYSLYKGDEEISSLSFINENENGEYVTQYYIIEKMIEGITIYVYDGYNYFDGEFGNEIAKITFEGETDVSFVGEGHNEFHVEYPNGDYKVYKYNSKEQKFVLK